MTARYLFTTDWHIGAGTEYAQNRLADQDDTLVQIARLASDIGADAVLFGGDCYHKPHPSNEARTVVQRFCDRLAGAGIPMVAVHGNSGHDIEAVDRATALGLHASGYVNVSRQPELIRAPGDLAVCTLPSVQLGRLVAARDGGDRHEVFADAVDLLLRTAEDLYEQVPTGWPSVLLGHWAADWPGMPPQILADQPVLPLDVLNAIGFDMVLMGHIHIPARVGNAISGGPPAHVSFGEAGLEHGCWVLTVEGPGQVEAEFVPLEDRRFLTVDIDLTEGGERISGQLLPRAENGVEHSGLPIEGRDGQTTAYGYPVAKAATVPADSLASLDSTDIIAAELGTLDLADAVLRIRYRASEAQHRRIDQGALKRLAIDKGCHRVYQILPDIVREQRARAEGVTEDLEPLAALEAWCEANHVAAPRRGALRDMLTADLERVAA